WLRLGRGAARGALCAVAALRPPPPRLGPQGVVVVLSDPRTPRGRLARLRRVLRPALGQRPGAVPSPPPRFPGSLPAGRPGRPRCAAARGWRALPATPPRADPDLGRTRQRGPAHGTVAPPDRLGSGRGPPAKSPGNPGPGASECRPVGADAVRL